LFSTLASCTSKEERCDQVAFALMKNGYINNQAYQSKGIQRACVKEWDTVCMPSVHGDCGKIENNGDWRDCILDAKTKEEMSPCGMFYVKAEKFN
jgi:hypothetical protein